MLLIALLWFSGAAKPQDSSPTKPDLSEIASALGTSEFSAITSKYVDGVLWVAVLQGQPDRSHLLSILKKPYRGRFTLVFKRQVDIYDLQSFAPVDTGRIIAFMLMDSHPDFWVGNTTIFALVGGQWQLVFGPETCSTQVIDLNSDGYPEVFESCWPDGDGYPEFTTIHAWTGKKFEKLMKTRFSDRFSKRVQAALTRSAQKHLLYGN